MLGRDVGTEAVFLDQVVVGHPLCRGRTRLPLTDVHALAVLQCRLAGMVIQFPVTTFRLEPSLSLIPL